MKKTIDQHLQDTYNLTWCRNNIIAETVNDEIIYDLPGRGVDLYDISWCGQVYDVSLSPVPMRPSRIEMWFQEDASSCAIYKIKDLISSI